MSTKLPPQYAWLARETGPRMLLEGLKTYGTREVPGPANNPVIMGWAREVGIERDYHADSVPWCGLWMAVVAKGSTWPVIKGQLWAAAGRTSA